MPVSFKSVILTNLTLLIFAPCFLFAQTEADSLAGYDTDELFAKGREYTFAGDRQNGRIYLEEALERSPDYSEIRVFLARTWLWDDQREKAEELLKPLLLENGADPDAIRVMYDAASWNNEPEAALKWANLGLVNNATDKDFQLRKAEALGDLELFDEALVILDGLLQRFPGDKAVLDLWSVLKVNLQVNSITAIANFDFYSDIFGNASLYSLQYGRRTDLGSVFLRVNETNRFGDSGWQGEIDLYPSIAKGLYAYLNYGYSPTALFPEHRAGAELYASLPWAFEASAGFRYLYFGPDAGVMMYTGTVGKYYGSYWLSARVFITPDEAGASQSLGIQMRRYFEKATHYLGLTGGFGFSPDFRNLQSSDGFSTQEIYKLKSNRIGINYQKPLGNSWLLNGFLDYARQEYLFDTGNFVGIWSLSFSARYAF